MNYLSACGKSHPTLTDSLNHERSCANCMPLLTTRRRWIPLSDDTDYMRIAGGILVRTTVEHWHDGEKQTIAVSVCFVKGVDRP